MRRAVDPKLAPLLHARASAMRAAPTTSEALLWEALRGSRLGVGFRRQVPIGRYIVDFCAPSARLVVEVDGGYHAERARADARRHRALLELGYRVVRVPAALVWPSSRRRWLSWSRHSGGEIRRSLG
jgi:very-short-patch-repair endonuclease